MSNRDLFVLLLRGLPGSGKSTLAKKLLKDSATPLARVNKDDLRAMHYFSKWHPKREGVVIQTEKALIRQLLASKTSVLVDNTNLGSKHADTYKALADEAGAKFSINNSCLSVPVEECIARDHQRGLDGGVAVGKDVILNMAFQYGLIKQEKPIVVFDLDGTITDASKRTYLVKKDPSNPKPNWPRFFEESVNDAPRTEVINMFREYQKTNLYDMIICSACPETYRNIRTIWLINHGIIPDRFIMRRAFDYRPDEIVKVEFINTYLDKSKIIAWIDDRPKVITAVRGQGITVVDVGQGEEF